MTRPTLPVDDAAASPVLTPCMGGWCALRDWCPHYHSTVAVDPAQRLCPPGRDGGGDVIAVRLMVLPSGVPA